MSTGQEIQHPRFRPGVYVKNGTLYAFTEFEGLMVRGWPQMWAWTRSCLYSLWQRWKPEIDFRKGIIRMGQDPDRPLAADAGTMDASAEDEALERERKLVRDFFSNVPLDVRDAIAPFETRRWYLFLMAARCPESLDLITSNPALAYCAASCRAFGPYSSNHAARRTRLLIHSRRREICGALGFPASESTVSILRKIPASACEVPRLLAVRELLKYPDWHKWLSHLPSLNLHVLHFLKDKALRRRTTPRLLRELCGCSSEAFREAAWLTAIHRDIGGCWPERFHSLQQIFRMKPNLDIRESDLRSLELPKPPVRGNEAIIALDKPDLLLGEALSQRNCVMSYIGGISNGSYYFYRVFKPERATLCIVWGPRYKWEVDQLLGRRNEPVSEATHQAVAEWLSKSQ
jgi:hypothetical protein